MNTDSVAKAGKAAADPSPSREHRTAPAAFAPPLSVGRAEVLLDGSDVAFRKVIYGLFVCGARLHQCRDAFGAAIGLTGVQYTLLMATAHLQEGREQEGHGVGIRALADHLHVAMPHVTTEVGKLVRAGMLAKRPNPRDRRGVLVSLTPAAEAALERLAPFLREINDTLFDNVSRENFEALAQFVDRFTDNSERAVSRIRLGKGRATTT